VDYLFSDCVNAHPVSGGVLPKPQTGSE